MALPHVVALGCAALGLLKDGPDFKWHLRRGARSHAVLFAIISVITAIGAVSGAVTGVRGEGQLTAMVCMCLLFAFCAGLFTWKHFASLEYIFLVAYSLLCTCGMLLSSVTFEDPISRHRNMGISLVLSKFLPPSLYLAIATTP